MSKATPVNAQEVNDATADLSGPPATSTLTIDPDGIKKNPDSNGSGPNEPKESNESESRQPRSRWIQLLFKFLKLFGIAVATIFVGLIILWLGDKAFNQDKVARNSAIAGYEIGGMTRAQLAAEIPKWTDRLDQEIVILHTSKGQVSTTLADLGLRIDPNQTVDQAFDYRNSQSFPKQFAHWLGSYTKSENVPLYLVADDDFYQRFAAIDPAKSKQATEPTIVYTDGKFVVVKGTNGKGIDPQHVVNQLEFAYVNTRPTIELETGTISPAFSTSDAQAVADQANDFRGVTQNFKVGTQMAAVSPAQYLPWFGADEIGGKLKLALDEKRATEGLAKLFSNAGAAPINAHFDLVGGKPVVVAGKNGTKCCGPDAVGLASTSIFARRTDQVVLPLTVAEPETTASELSALGVVEQVSTFTTAHPVGQPRVQNIHRIADIVRGYVIKPGETFSVNAYVGPRTTAKGFVVDHVIINHKFSTAVGGGVSQFATTTFNAAFYAGLEIPEHQSHSLYISRYPYGMDATLSYPKPDLRITNNTKYGVMIWPTYTGSNVTVSMYSTKNIDAKQAGQTESASGKCTVVRTTRERTFLDTGKVVTDSFRALYHPKEGVLC